MVLFLLLLVSLATVSHVSGQVTPFTTSTEVDIKTCPFKFFGKEYQKLYVDTSGNKVSVCFKGKRDTSDNDCLLLGQVWCNLCAVAPLQNVEVQVGGKKVTTWEIKEKGKNIPKDASACRHSGVLRDPQGSSGILRDPQWFSGTLRSPQGSSGTLRDPQGSSGTLRDPQGPSGILRGAVVLPEKKGCGSDGSSVTCSASAVSKTTPCGSGKKCEGEGLCVALPPPKAAVCTVTGSTVIDVDGKAASIPDRCAYTLMSETGVKLQAVFQDRRRTDVSFLDHVILHLDGPDVKIHLEQGGRVTLKDKELTLSSTPATHHDVELTKDQTGVTAKLLKSKYGTSVFFDGYTAQIYTKVPSGTTMPGLCGKSSRTLSEVKVSDLSSDSCDKVTKETDGNKFECTEMTKRCDLLKTAPFDSCHSSIKPDPYIKACSDTLCKYPAVDGLKCQFLQAYVKACSLLDKKVEKWRTSTSCSSDKAFCQDTFCSAHEFCAEDTSGGTSCLCRSSFASKYRKAKTFGEPTVCDKNSASVSLARCLMEEKNIDYSVLHLNDKTCKGQRDEKTHMVTFDFKSDTCGTVLTAEDKQLKFKNSIVAQDSSGSKITRHDEVKIDLSCFYTKTKEETMSFKIKDSSVTQTIVSGAWEYTLTMNAFTDASRTQAVSSSTEILLDQTVWVELKTAGLDDKLVAVVTDSCWATNDKSPTAKLKYDLIKNGCPDSADKTAKVESNGKGTSTYFSFNMFQFSGESGDVYLHCKLNLCVKKDNTCTKSCDGSKRRRRSARNRYVDENPAFITMAWSN
ncbi:alpha-tectorin-like [Scomber japonicus]|uniref:alpha-tectorin-like n=1 Tax=Scomber japonicus TaxID=13676 RepID=UPI002306AC69|nr:alpha-tectorin-like [Scomber japonicus]